MTELPNIVWITTESIRYDHTSLSDYRRDTTPSIRQIAARRDANSFSNCITHGIWTGTSSASILTGTTPPTHGIKGGTDFVLSDDVATIPEMLPEEYTTFSLISNPNAGPARGLDRGFDRVEYADFSTLRENFGLQRIAKSALQFRNHGGGVTTDISRHKGLMSYMMVDTATEFIAKQNDPYFMYIHPNSSHHPYLPPAAYLDEFTDELSISRETAIDIAQSRYEDVHEVIANGALSAGELDAVAAMYDATIKHIDHCVGQIVKSIFEHDGDTIIVLTADHGDLLGERGLVGHKFIPLDGLIHVPLVTHGIDEIDNQTEEVVQHIDIINTILSKIGVKHDQLEGLDLAKTTREFAVTQRSGEGIQMNLEKVQQYNSEYEAPFQNQKTLTSVRSKKKKLLCSEDDCQMFNIPDETTDVKNDYPDDYERMKTYVTEWLKQHETQTAAKRGQELDSKIKERLSDMGYLK